MNRRNRRNRMKPGAKPEAEHEKHRLDWLIRRGRRTPAVLWQLGLEILYLLPVVMYVYRRFQERLPSLDGLPLIQVAGLFLLLGYVGWFFAGGVGFWRALLQLVFTAFTAWTAAHFAAPELSAVLLLAFVGFAAALRGRALRHRQPSASFEPTFALVGLLSYALLPIFVRLDPGIADQRARLTLLGVALLGILLFRVGRANLMAAEQRRNRTSAPALRWKNRLWAAVVFGLSLLVGFLQPIFVFLREGSRTVWDALVRFYLLLLPGGPTEPAPLPSAQPPMVLPSIEPEKSRPFWDVVELIARYAFLAAALLLIAYAAYRGGRRVPADWRKLVAFLKRKLGGSKEEDESEGYVDEKESVLELSEAPRLLLSRLKNWFRERTRRDERWSEMADSREKMRYLYRVAVEGARKRGYRPEKGKTPLEIGWELENMPMGHPGFPDLAAGYSSVRYGEKQPDEEELERLANDMLPQSHKRAKGAK
ncbi:DUF4129 domain-containing protein [Gorillibacterium sp. CAU 1737]|uniref:DUF4129 domain-containing protein n=1 Tax=Gorillibacterium sp. CAU 1737 TaxID=3140362 RepID=UPI003260A3CE